MNPDCWRSWGREADPDTLRAFMQGSLSESPPRSEQIRLHIKDCEQLDLEVFPGANQLDLLEE